MMLLDGLLVAIVGGSVDAVNGRVVGSSSGRITGGLVANAVNYDGRYGSGSLTYSDHAGSFVGRTRGGGRSRGGSYRSGNSGNYVSGEFLWLTQCPR